MNDPQCHPAVFHPGTSEELRAVLEEIGAAVERPSSPGEFEHTIVLESGATYDGLENSLDLRGHIVVEGNDASIDGGNRPTEVFPNGTRVLQVHRDATVQLRQLTIIGGAGEQGSGILNQGELSLIECTV